MHTLLDQAYADAGGAGMLAKFLIAQTSLRKYS